MRGPLFALLGAVVAMGTKGLPIVPVPEQTIIATMRDDMIKVRGRPSAHDTMRMGVKVSSARTLPFGVVTTLAGRGAASVVACLAGFVAGLLASATLTGRDDLATGTKAGRCNRH